MTTNNNHPELLDLVHPEQLAKEYGGLAEMPVKAWPPVFPKGKMREDFSGDHITEEELKTELANNSRVMPPPNLAAFAREHCKATNKKGLFPRKTLYIKGRTERRDSFNGTIDNVPASAITTIVNEEARIQTPVKSKELENKPEHLSEKKTQQVLHGNKPRSPEKLPKEPDTVVAPSVALSVAPSVAIPAVTEVKPLGPAPQTTSVNDVKVEIATQPIAAVKEVQAAPGEVKAQSAQSQPAKLVEPMSAAQPEVTVPAAQVQKPNITSAEPEKKSPNSKPEAVVSVSAAPAEVIKRIIPAEANNAEITSGSTVGSAPNNGTTNIAKPHASSAKINGEGKASCQCNVL